MPQLPIIYIDVRFFIHATEDPDKVAEAVQRVLPNEYASDITFNRHNVRGHYGNPITLFETRIKDKKIIKAFIENLSAHIDDFEKETLLTEIDRYIEKGSLYVRLDKQVALQDELRLCTEDPIRVRIRFKKSKPQDIIEICRELGLLKAFEE